MINKDIISPRRLKPTPPLKVFPKVSQGSPKLMLRPIMTRDQALCEVDSLRSMWKMSEVYRKSGCYNVKDIYSHYNRWIKRTKPKNPMYRVTLSIYSKFVTRVNNLAVDKVMKEGWLWYWPCKMGIFGLFKRKLGLPIDKRGNVKLSHIKIDYLATSEKYKQLGYTNFGFQYRKLFKQLEADGLKYEPVYDLKQRKYMFTYKWIKNHLWTKNMIHFDFIPLRSEKIKMINTGIALYNAGDVDYIDIHEGEEMKNRMSMDNNAVKLYMKNINATAQYLRAVKNKYSNN